MDQASCANLDPPLTSCSHFSGGGTWLSSEMTLALCCGLGEVASQRLAQGSLGLGEATRLCRQLAEGKADARLEPEGAESW